MIVNQGSMTAECGSKASPSSSTCTGHHLGDVTFSVKSPGFSDTISSTANPPGLLHFLKTRNPNTGVGCSSGENCDCDEVPPAPPSMHVHHLYIDDLACERMAGVDHQGRKVDRVGGDSSGDEEIRVRTAKGSVVTVETKKRRERHH